MASLTKLFILILIVSSAKSALFFHHSLRKSEQKGFNDYLYLDKVSSFLSNLKHKMKQTKLFAAHDEKGGKLVLESLLKEKVKALPWNLREPRDWVRLYKRSSSYRQAPMPKSSSEA